MLIITIMALLLFGIVYNKIVESLERDRHDRGYTAFLVIFGTAITVAASVPLIGLANAAIVLACFAASGLPMTIGSVWRHVRARAAEEQALRQAAMNLLSEEPRGDD